MPAIFTSGHAHARRSTAAHIRDGLNAIPVCVLAGLLRFDGRVVQTPLVRLDLSALSICEGARETTV